MINIYLQCSAQGTTALKTASTQLWFIRVYVCDSKMFVAMVISLLLVARAWSTASLEKPISTSVWTWNTVQPCVTNAVAMIVCIVNSWRWIACEQALWCALAAGQEKEGELATMSPEFEYLHQKSWCEMLIGRDDINKLVMTSLCLAHVFQCLSTFVFLLLHADWQKSDSSVNAEPQGNWR